MTNVVRDAAILGAGKMERDVGGRVGQRTAEMTCCAIEERRNVDAVRVFSPIDAEIDAIFDLTEPLRSRTKKEQTLEV
jgi:hypothetical protein